MYLCLYFFIHLLSKSRSAVAGKRRERHRHAGTIVWLNNLCLAPRRSETDAPGNNNNKCYYYYYYCYCYYYYYYSGELTLQRSKFRIMPRVATS